MDLFDIDVAWDESAGATSYQVSLIGDRGLVAQEAVTTTTATFSRAPGGADLIISVVAGNAGGISEPASITVTTPSLNETFYNVPEYNNLEADPGFDASAFEFGTLSSPPNFTLGAMPAGYTAATIPTGFDANLVAPLDGRTLVDTLAIWGGERPFDCALLAHRGDGL